MESSRPLILGSSSSFRKLVLTELGVAFECMSPDVDEKAIRDTNPSVLTLRLAHIKADALLAKLKAEGRKDGALLVTSDQVVVCNGVMREKPRDAAEARFFLESYAQYPAMTVTSLVVTDTSTGRRLEGVEHALQYFHPIPPDVIQRLIEEGRVFHTAGGFIVEHPLLAPFLGQRTGSEASIRGMPIDLLKKLLGEMEQHK